MSGNRVAKSTMYRIIIPKFSDHNPTSKKSYKHCKIATNFCTDTKLSSLPLSWRWLYLGLLLECANNGRGVVEISEKHIRTLTETSASTDRVLSALQSLQVLSYEVIPPLINKLINKLNNVNPDKESEKQKPEKPLRLKSPNSNFDFEEFYKKYPIRKKGQDAEKRFHSQIKNPEDAEKLNIALKNYVDYLAKPENSWRQPKQTFSAFLGTKSSGYFWHDWIVHEPEAFKLAKQQEFVVRD